MVKKLEESYKNIKQVISNDEEVKKYNEYRSVCVQTYDSENEVMNLHVECGKDSGQGLKYLEGNAPKNKNQIALSYLNANKVGKKTGDEIKILCNGTEKSMAVSGIYQDVTSGGYTAKSMDEFIGILI